MRCGEARRQLYLQERPGAEALVFPADADLVQAEHHASLCEACRSFFEAQERLGSLIKSRAPRERSPASLREGVLAAVAFERKASAKSSRVAERVRRRTLWVGLVACLAILLAGGLWVRSRRVPVPSIQLASALIDDHARTLPSEAEVASADREIVQSWFEAKLGLSFHLPSAIDSELIGGRVCSVAGRRVALIFYRQPKARISLFVFDGSDVVLPENELVSIDGKNCLIDSKKGYNAVMWRERGVIYGLVSDARRSDLLQLAAQF